MKLESKIKRKSAQKIHPAKRGNWDAQHLQNEIFRKMDADKKILLGSQLWRLAKALAGDKINYANNRSEASSGRHRKNS